MGKEIVSRCLELRLTIDKRLEAEGGVCLGSGTDVMSADRLSFLHGCCQTLLRRAKVVYCVTVVCHCCDYSSTRAHVFMLKHGMSIGH